MSKQLILEEVWQAICPDCEAKFPLPLTCTVTDGELTHGPKFEVDDLFAHAWKCQTTTEGVST